MRRSITTRLVVMFAVAALVTLTLIGTALYGVLRSELARHQQEELRTMMQDLSYWLARLGSPSRWSRFQARLDAQTPANGSVRFWVLSDDPRFQYGSGLAELELPSNKADGLETIHIPNRRYPLHTITRTIPGFDERPPIRMIIAIDAESYYNTLHTFLIAVVALTLSAVLLVVLLGYWVARVGLRPLQRLSEEAQALRPSALSQRLQVATLPAELSDLAVAFNGALSRLEGAYKQLEAFNADVAHELRTPLTNLIGETQVALSRPRTAPQFEEVLQSNLEELDRLRAIINDMLFLARADEGEAATGLVVEPIVCEVQKTVDFLEFLLDDMQMTAAIEGDADLRAPIDTALFRRAMTNLLHNAIQHSERGAHIDILVSRSDRWVRIAVRNPGETVAAQHLPRLFDRFYRVDAARNDTGQNHGHGLGLAIVKAVATMHGGQVFADSADGVTTIGFMVQAT
jgi:two-component system heavy metal sensor histidine kinase CusS